jgi:hypothetical protein
MASRSRRLLKSVVVVGTGLAVVLLWYLTPYHRGVLMGHIDHGRGHYELKLYGGPPPSPDLQEKVTRYARLLEDRYGVELNPVTGCIVTWELVEYCNGYNATSRRLLIDRHGKDVFAECAVLAGLKGQDE